MKEVLKGLSVLDEKAMKNTNMVDLLSEVLSALKDICYCDVDISKPQFRLARLFQPFWQDITVKLVSSSSSTCGRVFALNFLRF